MLYRAQGEDWFQNGYAVSLDGVVRFNRLEKPALLPKSRELYGVEDPG
jgi:predicted GH43/DUF377 family glycosyl hydrolase